MIHDSALPFLIFLLLLFFFAGHMKRKHGDSGSHHSFFFFFIFFDTCFWTWSGKGTGEFTKYGFSKIKYFNTMTKKTSLPGFKLNSTLLLWVGVGVAQGFGSTGCSSYCDGRWNLWSAGASLDDISPGRTAACCWTLLDASWKRNNRMWWLASFFNRQSMKRRTKAVCLQVIAFCLYLCFIHCWIQGCIDFNTTPSCP